MNKTSIIMKIACWVGYCLFAGYSAYMTAKSVAMSFEMTQVWMVFIFVFIVALIAGYCLSVVIGEMQNSFNPSKSKFALGLIGFILFWIAVGMLLTFFLRSTLLIVLLIVLFLVLGYRLFCS